MSLEAARFANLLLSALMVGNEFGGLVAVHPALATLELPVQVAAERAVTRRYKAIMPFLMTTTLISVFPVLARLPRRKSAPYGLTAAGAVSFGLMLGITLLGNMPINTRILAASPAAPPADWGRLRARWNRLHALRNALNVTGLSCLLAAALAPPAGAPSGTR
jgi:uncharacterized membrane protein